MNVKRDLVSCMLSFCVAALLFTAIPVIGQVGEYDPWLDINDDGYIGIDDIFTLAEHFGAEAGPEDINKTELLLSMQTQIEAMNTTIIELLDCVSTLNMTIDCLNQTVIELNETVVILNGTGLRAPDYDSGWFVSYSRTSHTLTHNLNASASELLVYILGKSDVYGTIHQYYYGSDNYFEWAHSTYHIYGIYWDSYDNNAVKVHNRALRELDNVWQHIRVKIWKIPQP